MLLLTDIHMPEMDGYELTAAVRQAEEGKRRAPIIAFTANALKGEAEHCRAVGMDDYLSKPVQLAHLRAILQKWMPAPATAQLIKLATPVAVPAAISVTQKPVDVKVLEQLVGDDPAVIGEFLQDFRVSAAKIGTELRAACVAGDAATAGAAAHKLKSAARSVGALGLGELCAEMERAGKAGDAEALNTLLPRFESELATVDKYIESLA